MISTHIELFKKQRDKIELNREFRKKNYRVSQKLTKLVHRNGYTQY